MAPTCDISEIASRLGISERHARRLRQAGDARLAAVDRDWAARWRAEQAANGMRAHLARLSVEIAAMDLFVEREKPGWQSTAAGELAKLKASLNALRDLVPMP